MRRKTIGFLILTLVVVAGVVFVERRLRHAGGADAWSEVESSVYRVVIGGEPPAEPAPPADDRPAQADAKPIDGGRRPPLDGAVPLPVTSPSDRPAPPRRPPNEFRYVVRKGDVLGAVVMNHLGTASPRAIEQVARDSGLDDPNRVAAGQELVLRVDVWEKLEARDGETLHDLARRAYGAPGRTEALRLANPHLPPTDETVVKTGTPVWVAR
ncbi:MAG: hypothetical protein ACF8XB_18855 [Planctomycetota bacterium JB042]